MYLPDLAELRNRGYTEILFPEDETLLAAWEAVWKYIELFTHQFFEKRSMTLCKDGEDDSVLFVGIPIVSITGVTEEAYGSIDMSEIVVYNRSFPEDWRNPRIAWTESTFPEGYQNVEITGTFGCVDSDGLPPKPLQEVAMRLMILLLKNIIGSNEEYASTGMSGAVIKYQTDRHMVQLAVGQAIEGVTDDPFVNSVLAMYRSSVDIVLGGWV